MKISYAVTVCDEFVEIQRLITLLLKNKRPQDEIVVLIDQSKGTQEVLTYLDTIRGVEGRLVSDRFEGHFADWKNLLTANCTGDFIFQIDADEIPHIDLIQNLPSLLETNQEVDVYVVPRINTVSGISEEHIKKWGWRVENDRINFPDYQWRIYRNSPSIKWINKVHEKLDGFKIYSTLPAQDEFCLLHPKTIERQEKQNNYYNTL